MVHYLQNANSQNVKYEELTMQPRLINKHLSSFWLHENITNNTSNKLNLIRVLLNHIQKVKNNFLVNQLKREIFLPKKVKAFIHEVSNKL